MRPNQTEWIAHWENATILKSRGRRRMENERISSAVASPEHSTELYRLVVYQLNNHGTINMFKSLAHRTVN